MVRWLLAALSLSLLAACGDSQKPLNEAQTKEFIELYSSLNRVTKASDAATPSPTPIPTATPTPTPAPLSSLFGATTSTDVRLEKLTKLIKDNCKIENINNLDALKTSGVATVNLSGDNCPLSYSAKVDASTSGGRTDATFSFSFKGKTQEVRDLVELESYEFSGKISMASDSTQISANYNGKLNSTKYGAVDIAVAVDTKKTDVYLSVRIDTADMNGELIAERKGSTATIKLNGKDLSAEEVQAFSK